MVSRIRSLGIKGIGGYEVSVECSPAQGLPEFQIVGLPDTAVREARDRVRAAIKNSGLKFPVSRLTVNLAPADTRKNGTVYDLPVLLGILAATGEIKEPPADCAFFGELSLAGELRPVRGALPMAFAAQAVLFALLPLLLGNRWADLAGVFAMGLLMYLLNTPAQMHALSLAEQDYPFASSLCASVQPVSYNFGIAIGSFIGSAVQEGWGFRPLGLPAAMFALAALGLNLLLLRANGRRTAAAAS